VCRDPRRAPQRHAHQRARDTDSRCDVIKGDGHGTSWKQAVDILLKRFIL
jgi:hypothetical protein